MLQLAGGAVDNPREVHRLVRREQQVQITGKLFVL